MLRSVKTGARFAAVNQKYERKVRKNGKSKYGSGCETFIY